MRDEDLRDVSGLGGLPLLTAAAVFAGVLGAPALVLRLAAGLAIGYLAVVLLRFAHFRPRPEAQAHRTLLQRLDANSFPSIHAMRAALFWALAGSATHRWVLWAVSVAAVLLVAWSRVALRRHHPGDVAVGVLIGLATAAAVLSAGPPGNGSSPPFGR